MADINSLINPPEETKDTIVPTREAPRRRRAAVKYEEEDEDYKDEDGPEEHTEEPEEHSPKNGASIGATNIANEDGTPEGTSGEPLVSQDTILSSFDRIKTHFPAARIKKIMQSDEDIGKVAQATPVVVGRALEIFMANLVEAAIIETKGAGVRRIAASHVRAAVEKTEQFDFLVDIVSKYSSTKN